MGELTHTRSCPALTPGNEESCTCGLQWRIVLRKLATEHIPIEIPGDGRLVISRGACSCGNLKADGVTPWRILWQKHIEGLFPPSEQHIPWEDRPLGIRPTEPVEIELIVKIRPRDRHKSHKVILSGAAPGPVKVIDGIHIKLLRTPGPDAISNLLAAAQKASEHIRELREAWQRGCIHETDGKGGTRSNRNADVDLLLAKAIAAAKGQP